MTNTTGIDSSLENEILFLPSPEPLQVANNTQVLFLALYFVKLHHSYIDCKARIFHLDKTVNEHCTKLFCNR